MAKITSIEIIPIVIPLKEPFVISRGARTEAKNIVVVIRTDEGLEGTGESCPYRSIHGETQAGCLAIGKEIARAMLGMNPLHIRDLVRLMDRMIVGNASIKCAFDMALYDIASRMAGLPLFAYLKGTCEKSIFTDMTLSLLPKEKMAEKAVEFKERGFPVLKVKLGDQLVVKDIERVEAIREAVGEELPLRIDINQGWNFVDGLHALKRIEHLGIEHCEEPINSKNRSDQIRLTRRSPIPIMADESVFDHFDAFQILTSGAADMINIKLGKSGGIHHAMKIAAIAEAAGADCQVGSFSESRLGITALTHFAFAWDNIRYYDLDSPLMMAQDPVIGGLSYDKHWQVKLTDEPGHGAQFDKTFLAKFDSITIS